MWSKVFRRAETTAFNAFLAHNYRWCFGQMEDHMRFSGNVFGVPAEFGDHYKAGAPTNQLRTLVLVFPPLVLSSSPHDTPAISRESKKLRGEK